MVAREWYRRLARRIECHLLTDQDKTGRSLIEGRLFRQVPLAYLRDAVWFSTQLARMCQELKPDLIHLHSHTGFVAFAPKEIPMVVTFHDEPAFIPRDNVSSGVAPLLSSMLSHSEHFLRNLLLRRHPWIHALSSTIKEQLLRRGISSDQISVIPNGFPVTKVSPPSGRRHQLLSKLGLGDETRIVVSVGNVAFRKGFHRILSTAALLKTSHPEIHFLVIGSMKRPLERAYAEGLRRRIRSLNLGTVHLLGYIEDKLLHEIMYHADLYLSTALSEACNLALMEAARYGLPIICTNVGAARDLFEGEAVILDAHASSDTIAQAIVQTLSEGGERRKYTCVREYSWPRVIKDLLSFYHTVIENKA